MHLHSIGPLNSRALAFPCAETSFLPILWTIAYSFNNRLYAGANTYKGAFHVWEMHFLTWQWAVRRKIKICIRAHFEVQRLLEFVCIKQTFLPFFKQVFASVFSSSVVPAWTFDLLNCSFKYKILDRIRKSRIFLTICHNLKFFWQSLGPANKAQNRESSWKLWGPLFRYMGYSSIMIHVQSRQKLLPHSRNAPLSCSHQREAYCWN